MNAAGCKMADVVLVDGSFGCVGERVSKHRLPNDADELDSGQCANADVCHRRAMYTTFVFIGTVVSVEDRPLHAGSDTSTCRNNG